MILPAMCRPAMFFVGSLRFVVALLVASSLTVAAISVEGQNPVCAKIAASISSSSNVYYPGIYVSNHALFHTIHWMSLGDPLYTKGINHWATSSIQLAKCVVEPGTAVDVGIIVRILFFTDQYKQEVNFIQAQYRWKHQNSFRSKSYRYPTSS